MATERPKGADSLFDHAGKLEDLGKYREAADLYLQAALGFVEAGRMDEAVTSLMSAAKTYEKDQDWRKIGALWDSTGEHIRSQLEQELLNSTTIDSLFRHKVEGVTTWEKQQDLNHRAAWAFQFAAQHFEREGGPSLVSNLFSKAGYSAEKTTNIPDHHRWIGMLFEKAAVYSIRAMATQEAGPNFDELLHKMEENYLQMGIEDSRNVREKYLYLSRGYRNIRLTFQAIGDPIKAEEIRRKELGARYKYESASRKCFQALMTWLTWHRWIVPATWALCVFSIFPLIYWLTRVLVGNQGATLTWYDYVSFSILVATTSGYGIVTPVGIGVLIAAAELVFSYALLALVVVFLVQHFVRLRGGD